jgi:hypothetical protein
MVDATPRRPLSQRLLWNTRVSVHRVGLREAAKAAASLSQDVIVAEAGGRFSSLAGQGGPLGGSALATNASAHAAEMAAKGVLARNFGSFEYARVPEGLVVRACAPNFDSWRKNDALECDPGTIVEIDTVEALRGCPRTGPYTLIDCLQPLQTDASVLSLHWRPADEAMHLG